MGHLTAARTKREITAIEIVSDDSLRVLKINANESGSIVIQIRDATESQWSAKTFATLDHEDAEIVSTVLNGGTINTYGSISQRIEGVPEEEHRLPKPEEIKDPMSGDCTPLDIERAKAANLKEQREIIELEMERDHSLDRHVGADVTGCPACERRISPGHGDGSIPEPDGDTEDLPF